MIKVPLVIEDIKNRAISNDRLKELGLDLDLQSKKPLLKHLKGIMITA